MTTAIVGVGNISGPHDPRSPWSRLPQFRWQSGGLENAEAVAALIWPWLGSVKRAQFENAMRLRRTGVRRSTGGSALSDG